MVKIILKIEWHNIKSKNFSKMFRVLLFLMAGEVRLDINKQKDNKINPIWKLQTALLNNSCEEIKIEIISSLELNDIGNTEYQ